jgi:hypothetical protein
MYKDLSKKSNINKSDIISASEIGQYQYCSISWKLQRNGYQPDSSYLEIGKNNHIAHGKIINYINILLKKSKILILIGFFLLLFAILILLLEVIL